jgi:hypothetical protein
MMPKVMANDEQRPAAKYGKQGNPLAHCQAVLHGSPKFTTGRTRILVFGSA